MPLPRSKVSEAQSGEETGGENFVQCDSCSKWRKLPESVNLDKLPGKWFCRMNTYDPERSQCTAPEIDYRQGSTSHAPQSPDQVKASTARERKLRKFIRTWVRRIKCGERAESRLPASMSTRGKRKKPVSVRWIQCCNPNCGKWRAQLRYPDTHSRTSRGSRQGPWFCVMNTWDEALASCAAPQETEHKGCDVIPKRSRKIKPRAAGIDGGSRSGARAARDASEEA